MGEDDELTTDSFDRNGETFITLGCYRETDRLRRMLRVFEKALTLTAKDQAMDALADGLISLHDHKGCLTVHWKSPVALLTLRRFVDAAWIDENECNVAHVLDPGKWNGEYEPLPMLRSKDNG